MSEADLIIEDVPIIPQHFLVCITIHKARELSVLNEDTYVAVNVRGTTKKTVTFQNSDCPYFNEYFVFEIYCSLTELLRSTVHISVFVETMCLKYDYCIGELTTDLSTVWNQQYHSFIKKWGQLEKPTKSGKKDPHCGYILLDLTINSKYARAPTSDLENELMPAISNQDFDVIEDDFLEVQKQGDRKIWYLVNIHRGHFVKKDDYNVQVTYCGITGRTTAKATGKTIDWNEQIKLPGILPSLCQLFIFQIKKKVTFEINLLDIYTTVEGANNLPTFGPKYLYLYDGPQNTNFIGKILVSIDSEIVDERYLHKFVKKAENQIVLPIIETDYWTQETFEVHFILTNLDFLHCSAKKVKMRLLCEDVSSNTVEMITTIYSKSQLRFVKFDAKSRPHLLLTIALPDERYKYQAQIDIQTLVQELKRKMKVYNSYTTQNVGDLKKQKRGMQEVLHFIKSKLKDLGDKIEIRTSKRLTQWMENYCFSIVAKITSFYELIEKCLDRLDGTKIKVECLYSIYKDLINIKRELQDICLKFESNLPVLTLVFEKGKLEGFYKFDPRLYFQGANQTMKNGKLCGNRHSILVKPVSCTHSSKKCGCIYAKADIIMWITTIQEKFIIDHWEVQEKEKTMSFNSERFYTMNIYCHQAKVRAGYDATGLCDPQLAIFYGEHRVTTKVIKQSLSPIWNEVLTIENLRFPIPGCELFSTLVIIVLYDEDYDGKVFEVVGYGYVKPKVKHTNDHPEDVRVIFERSKMAKENKIYNDTLSSFSDTELAKRKSFIEKGFKKLKNKKIKIPDCKVPRFDFDGINLLFPPPMEWISIIKNSLVTAEILMSAELIEIQATDHEPLVKQEENIPDEIRPIMRKFCLTVIFAGVRQCNILPRRTVGRYSFEVSLGELALRSGLSTQVSGHTLNFLEPFSTGYLYLPEQYDYWPPLVLKHYEHSGKKEIVTGAAILKHPEKFLLSTIMKLNKNHLIQISDTEDEATEHQQPSHKETEPLIPKVKAKVKPKEPLESKKFKLTFGDKMKKVWGGIPSLSAKKFKKIVPESSDTSLILNEVYTWWTKYYNARETMKGNPNHKKHIITIYDSELENQKEFSKMQDWAIPIAVVKQTYPGEDMKDPAYGIFKCGIKIERCEGKDNFEGGKILRDSFNFHSKQISALLESETAVIVRVYAVEGINLVSKDVGSYADAYLLIEMGGQTVSDQKFYIPNQTNPIFGRLLEIKGIIPKDHILKISVYDHSIITKDVLIGSTTIDIEDRLNSKHHASCGIAHQYNRFGYNMWRNGDTPSEILKKICKDNDIAQPEISDDKIQVAGITFYDKLELSEDEKKEERLCLAALNQFHTIPDIGFKLVPEHVETRSLYRDDRPGIVMGQLVMWLEIHLADKVPPPIDLTPELPRRFELRCIIWDTKDVILNETNVFGSKMSDIYVKCWLDDIDEAQYTDVHYRSLTGEGNFNWRMVFPFTYLRAEEMMIITKKRTTFEIYDTQIKIPTVLSVQIWDNDSFSSDDFLGTLTLNLSHFTRPTSSAKFCSLARRGDFVNLFGKKKIRGWFPMYGRSNVGKTSQTGKVDMELEILSEDEALAFPAGKGREGPQALPEPKRPDTSFSWYTSPFKSLKHIIWPVIKKCLCYVCGVILLIMLVLGLIYLIMHLTEYKLEMGFLS